MSCEGRGRARAATQGAKRPGCCPPGTRRPVWFEGQEQVLSVGKSRRCRERRVPPQSWSWWAPIEGIVEPGGFGQRMDMS